MTAQHLRAARTGVVALYVCECRSGTLVHYLMMCLTTMSHIYVVFVWFSKSIQHSILVGTGPEYLFVSMYRTCAAPLGVMRLVPIMKRFNICLNVSISTGVLLFSIGDDSCEWLSIMLVGSYVV